MIPPFPAFAKLGHHHQTAITDFVSRYEPYHDFRFSNLFCWNLDGSTQISGLNGNLVFSLPDYFSGERVVTLLGEQKIDESLEALLETSAELKYVPETVIRKIRDSGKFKVEEDRDSFDYVYGLETVASLPGAKFKNKRNKTNAVKKAFEDRMTTERINSIEGKLAAELLELFQEWAEKSDKTGEEQRFETIAFKRMLGHADYFNLLVTTVSIDGSLIGFSINEIIENGFAICHFEKALASVHEQIGSFVAYQATKDLRSAGCHYVNWEPDLGIAGLRKSKTSFHPDYFLKKYIVKKAA